MKKKALWMLLAAVLTVGILTLVLVIRDNAQRESTYQQATQAVREGDPVQAYRLFCSLGSYRDAARQAADLAGADCRLPCLAAEKGDAVFFGRWEQDGDGQNGPEPIEWLVLDRVDGQLLLLCADCLAAMPYHEEAFAPVTWETCSLRAWLNGDFLSAAFTEAERVWIPAVRNENPDHSIVETPGGRDTTDRVFLLSERDTVIYLKDEDARSFLGKAPASRVAQAEGLQLSEDGFASWWLRSPGMYEYIAQFVDQEGVPYLNGASTDIGYLCGVRPAIWLDMKGEHP